MTESRLMIVLPNRELRSVGIGDDVKVHEFVDELVRLLKFPTLGPDHEALVYRVNSRSLGRSLNGAETLSSAGVPDGDRLILGTDLTAGAGGGNLSESPRMRRLRGDYELMQELAGRTDMISFVAQSPRPNLPPERYIVSFKCRSIATVDRRGNPQYSNHHQVEIYLHNQYPQRWPGMKWLTPIWHPNINHLNGSVCIDAAWWTASRSLDRLVIMLGEMLQYKNYHDDPTKPPFPWDPEAARWSREYRKKHPDIFPVDQRELMRPERVRLNAGAAESGARKPAIRLDKEIPTPRPAPSVARSTVAVKVKPAGRPKARVAPRVKVRLK
jgi:ubiquitin-protein ligase